MNLLPRFSTSSASSGQPPVNRVDKILSHIDPANQSGLEIGALCRPIVAPERGPVRYVDHMDTAGLRGKYAVDPNVDVDKIVDVSFVWGEHTLPEAVGDERFDYVVASHVIEHVPDTVGWLREIAAVLKPGGILSLAIPDKRFTFDARRENTTFAALIESHLLGRRHPGFREVLDHFDSVVAVPGQVTAQTLWRDNPDPHHVPHAHPGIIDRLGEDGLRHYFNLVNGGLYMDVHVHVFTPDSLMRILARLACVGMLNFRVAHFFPTAQDDMEFFVSLERLPDGLSSEQRQEDILKSLPEGFGHAQV
ncbi:MAG: methyltransferase [Burkholderiales bacterium PBB3]|nr:MAG: methyltransferase [Burkholderiales bacterium PBB3]